MVEYCFHQFCFIFSHFNDLLSKEHSFCFKSTMYVGYLSTDIFCNLIIINMCVEITHNCTSILIFTQQWQNISLKYSVIKLYLENKHNSIFNFVK